MSSLFESIFGPDPFSSQRKKNAEAPQVELLVTIDLLEARDRIQKRRKQMEDFPYSLCMGYDASIKIIDEVMTEREMRSLHNAGYGTMLS